jgi:hypothetical protein
MIDREFRRYLDELAREQDRLQHEHEREVQANPPAGEMNSVDIVYKDFLNIEPVATAEPPDGEDDGLDDYTKGIAKFVCLYLEEKLDERDAKIAKDLEERDHRLLNTMLRHAYVAERAEEQVHQIAGQLTRVEQQFSDLKNRRADRDDGKIAKLEAGITGLRRVVEERHARSVEIATVKGDADAGRLRYQERAFENSLALRDSKIEKLEAQLTMLLKFLSLNGLNLPEGL